MAAGRNGTYSGMAESPFCAAFHPSQSRRTGEILLLRRQRGRIGRCARVGEPRRGWQRVEGGHSTLKLGKPVDPELYRHLTGESAL